MRRRELLKLAAFGGAAMGLPKAARAVAEQAFVHPPVIDTHIHLFDTTRPGGVPWPPKDDAALYRPALPPRYIELSRKHGVVGAIAIEASPLNSDNDWLLKVVEANPVMVGMVGDLMPGSPPYQGDLERLRKNPLFLGIRYGNIWDRDLSGDLSKPGFMEGLKALAAAGLTFDSANPDEKLLAAILMIAEAVPNLRMVIDHLPHAVVPSDPAGRQEHFNLLRSLAKNPSVFVKLSEIPLVVNGAVVTDSSAYTDHLDAIWEIFGEDHLLFGSDWPNSDHVAPYDAMFPIVQRYIAGKGSRAANRYFWKNSIAAYHWKPRRPVQQLS